MEMLSNKWVATVGMWIQCSSGVYTFSVYSSVLKSSQGYDQSTLETVAVFRDIGSSAGVLSGLQYTAVTYNNNYSGYFRGPWLVHLAGAIQGFFGYFLMWAAVVGLIERPRLPVMCLFMLLSTHSITFFNTANIVSGVQNFPQFSGTVVGIMKVIHTNLSIIL